MALRNPVSLNQYRGHKRTVAPAVEPVTADELRAHLRETATGLPDAEANGFIAQARAWIEEQSGLALVTQTWLLALDRWPGARADWWDGVREGSISELYGPESYSDVSLPRYPLQSIAGINVYDEAGNATAVTVASVFDVDTYSKPGRIALKRGATWPVALRAVNAIEISYVAGYGDAASDVDPAVKQSVVVLASYLYAHRGDGCSFGDAMRDSGAGAIIGTYQTRGI